MTTATIKKNKKLVINEEILDKLGVNTGDQVSLTVEEGKLEIKPYRKSSLFGFLKGKEFEFIREEIN